MKSKNIILIICIIIVLGLIGFVCYGYFMKQNEKQIQNPIATIEVEGYGTMKVELYPDIAPNTVKNFITLSNNGFYNGLTFHRIVKDFMIQGGDPEGTGSGGASLADIDTSIEKDSDEDKEYAIKGEFIVNGYEDNTLRHEKGVISMARSDYSAYGKTTEGYNTASSQFFIMIENTPSLNGSYAAFGKVVEGLDVLEKIANAKIKEEEDESAEASTPEEPPVITSITVDTFGVNYKKPETIEPFDINSWFMSQYGIG